MRCPGVRDCSPAFAAAHPETPLASRRAPCAAASCAASPTRAAPPTPGGAGAPAAACAGPRCCARPLPSGRAPTASAVRTSAGPCKPRGPGPSPAPAAPQPTAPAVQRLRVGPPSGQRAGDGDGWAGARRWRRLGVGTRPWGGVAAAAAAERFPALPTFGGGSNIAPCRRGRVGLCRRHE
jgi:hypothetical protein